MARFLEYAFAGVLIFGCAWAAKASNSWAAAFMLGYIANGIKVTAMFGRDEENNNGR